MGQSFVFPTYVRVYLRNTVKEAADKGLSVISYTSGRKDQLDVAVRRTVLTGVSQTAGMLTEARMDEMGVDLVQTSAHIGARNKGDVPENHEMWQGRIFSRSGTHPKYPNFYEITGYGTVTGLYGINCRHSHYAFYEGISEQIYNEAMLQEYASKTVTYNGQEMSYYDATQKQREIERKIRYWKRQASGLEAAGLDNTFERLKMGEWQAEMRRFVKETGLIRQSEREQVAGVGLRALSKKPEGGITQPALMTENLENPEARQAAKELLSRRTIEEPGITALVSDSVEGAGGRMEGLEYRLKSEDSLTRKIAGDMAGDKKSLEEAIDDVNDVNRYTGIFDGQVLIKQASQVHANMKKNGFEVIKITNTFGKKGAYQGLHFVFKHRDGRVFELQFHTPQSIKIKNEIHRFYEEFRTSTNKIRKNELARKMIEKWSGFIPPDDWENIVDFQR